MLSKKINVTLGISAIALTGVAAIAVALGNGGAPRDTVTSASARIDAEPPTAQTPELGTPSCGKHQAASTLLREINSTYFTGKESPRTPLVAIDLSNQYDAELKKDGELTYEPFGEAIKEGDSGYRHESYLARKPDGRIRAYYSVAGGTDGGGWAVETYTTYTTCADIPSDLKPPPLTATPAG